MKNRVISQKKKKNRGIALFIAIFVSGVVLVIGASVMDISLKEMKLSSLGRESSKAFYAADTGLECALYWDDILNNNGGTVFPKDNSPNPDPYNDLGDCAGSIDNINVDNTSSPVVTSFRVMFGGNSEPCANVVVSKTDNTTYVTTTIESRGLNSCDLTNPRISERGVKITYTNNY